jgi:hypothetical protein
MARACDQSLRTQSGNLSFDPNYRRKRSCDKLKTWLPRKFDEDLNTINTDAGKDGNTVQLKIIRGVLGDEMICSENSDRSNSGVFPRPLDSPHFKRDGRFQVLLKPMKKSILF